MKANDQLKDITKNLRHGAKLLFANSPAKEHFNPLTGLAVHLKEQGYDVRWYTSPIYQTKIEELGIQFYPLEKALDVTTDKVIEMFPERENHKSALGKLNFDIINAFILRGPEYFEDIQMIHKTFAFDLLIADVAFTGIPFVKDKMGIQVVALGAVPLIKSSRELPLAGLTMAPSTTVFGRLQQALLRFAGKRILFAKSNKVMHQVFGRYGIECDASSIFGLLSKKSDLILQSGMPGFEYKGSDLDEKVKFIGPMLPSLTQENTKSWFDERLTAYKKIVLVTQDTAEKDSTKLFEPTLEALINSEYLVVVATGGSDTDKLRQQYAAPNIIIEDFIPSADIMPYADVYVTNGGMGGVLLSIENKLPIVAAGIQEGKNEVGATVSYFNLGVNLKTERPAPEQIRKSVDEVTSHLIYHNNVEALSREVAQYNPLELSTQYIQQLLRQKTETCKVEQVEKVFIMNQCENRVFATLILR